VADKEALKEIARQEKRFAVAEVKALAMAKTLLPVGISRVKVPPSGYLVKSKTK